MTFLRTDIAFVFQRNPGLRHRSRFVRMRFAVVSSDRCLRIDVQPGTLSVTPVEVTAGELTAGESGAEFVITASSDAWASFAQPEPGPGYHDIVAMIESGHARIAGDLLPFFRHLFIVKAAVAAVFTGAVSW